MVSAGAVSIGERAISHLATAGRAARLAVAAVAALTHPPWYPREIVRALAEAGRPRTMVPVILLMATIGAIAALQGVAVLRMFGADRLLAGMLAQTVIRDLAPTMTALMLAAQVGTAIAGEIGAMRVSEETDALRTMSVDPVRFLVAPRLLALSLITPLAAGLGAASALGAAYVSAVFVHGAAAGPFVAALSAQLSMSAIGEGLWKAEVFGFICGLIACHHGMEARGGSEGVGRAVNATIVQSTILVAAAEAGLTAILLQVAR